MSSRLDKIDGTLEKMEIRLTQIEDTLKLIVSRINLIQFYADMDTSKTKQ
jgi:hypothetical protein